MAVDFRLPKRDVDLVVVLNTPLATDATLAFGELTVLDELGNEAIVTKFSNITGWKETAYSAGVASVKSVDFSTIVAIQANTAYKLTIDFPNRINFFGGGRETGAIYDTRTYVVSTDATPTAIELANAFESQINNDLMSGVTVVNNAAGLLTLTSTNVNAGEMLLTVPVGATITTVTPYSAPSGSVDEVVQYVNPSNVITGGQYTRFEIAINRETRHNGITGLVALRPTRVFVYAEENAVGFAAFETQLVDVLAGLYTPVSDYLGAPVLP